MKKVLIVLTFLLIGGVALTPGLRASVEQQPATEDPKPQPPKPIDIPEIDDLHDLMEEMGDEHKKAGNKKPEVARRAAVELEKLALASLHERFVIDEPEYREFAADLWRANQQLQEALANPNDRKGVLDAFKAQNGACNACHKKYRPEED